MDRVIAYGSRNLKPSERFYQARNVEFLALKDDTNRWLRINGPVILSYFYSKMLFLVSSLIWYKNGGH